MKCMELTINQFEILTNIIVENDKLSQRRISELTGLSLGTVNKTLLELSDNNYITD